MSNYISILKKKELGAQPRWFTNHKVASRSGVQIPAPATPSLIPKVVPSPSPYIKKKKKLWSQASFPFGGSTLLPGNVSQLLITGDYLMELYF